MRYQNVALVSYTHIDGKQYKIRDIREIPDYNVIGFFYPNRDDMQDEIITRREYYGEGGALLSYAISEANAISMWENGFDIGSIQKVIVPVVS